MARMPTPEMRSGVVRWAPLLRWLLLLAAFVAAYGEVLKGLAGRWLNDPDASYGMLVPLVSGYLVWRVWPVLRRTPTKPDARAFPLVAGALLLAALGVSAALPSVARLSMPLLLLAGVWYLAGARWLRLLAFPLGFLVFMLPLPAQLQALLTPGLQQMAVWLGERLLRLAGHAASSRGNTIWLDGQPLNVAEACSGLRYIFPLLGVGVLYAGLFETVAWKRVVNVLAAAPIAILMNGARIAGAGMMMARFGEQAVTGVYHAAEGYIVLTGAFGLHFLFGRWLRRLPPRSDEAWVPAAPGSDMDYLPIPGGQAAWLGVLLLALWGWQTSLGAIPAWRLPVDQARFPPALPGWVGQRASVPERIVEASGATEAWSAVYRSIAGKRVHLYIGYQGAPFGAGSRFFHSPDICLPAAGWRTLSSRTRFIGPMEVTEQLSQQAGRRLLVTYWFQNSEGVDAAALAHRWRLMLQALRHESGYDLFVRVTTEIAEGEKIENARARVTHFIGQLATRIDDLFAAACEKCGSTANAMAAPEPGRQNLVKTESPSASN